MARQIIVAGNWKMNKTFDEGIALSKEIVAKTSKNGKIVILAPPFTHLAAVKAATKSKKYIKIAAQNCHQEEKGAYTGEISVDMLKSIGVDYVILGHSERRQYAGETDELLAKKINLVLAKGLLPIFCCGEALDIRQAGTHEAYVSKQIENSLFHLSEEEILKVVIAYEPIWAIGTGVTASTAQAQEMHAALRKGIAKKYSKKIANKITILYGGSCNAKNANDLFAQPDVDGGLIGGASLIADDFVTIINA